LNQNGAYFALKIFVYTADTKHRKVIGRCWYNVLLTSLAVFALTTLVKFHTNYPELNNSAIKILMPISGNHKDS